MKFKYYQICFKFIFLPRILFFQFLVLLYIVLIFKIQSKKKKKIIII